MFIKSAASDTLQGRAIHAVNTRFGEGKWNGRETIGIPVCKKKYSPFNFKIVRNPKNGTVKVTVERMFGCKCHSDLRKSVIEQHGVRSGWEPFGQWSLRKAQEKARRETERLNGIVESDAAESSEWSSDDENKALTICHNGNCTWKVREKFDNVKEELRDDKESEDDEAAIYARYYPSKAS